MITYEYGNPEADTVLIQPTGEHYMASLDNEVREFEKSTSKEFRFIATKVENWNDDLSPWKAPAVFKTEDFCGGASKTLENIIALCADKNRKYYIGGYSLAGLFALWAACQTDIFSGVAAASPSVWFPGFIDYMKTYKMKSQNVYLSLGDREEKTRIPVMAQICYCIKDEYRCLLENGINCILEWNKGNHFKEADIRTAKAFAWILNNDSSGERTTRLSNL